MNHASLFSGIGGFDLAAEWMGWNNMFQCEINPFCQKILNYYWPNEPTYEDIKTTDFSVWRGRIDILTGGFPCQPYSSAGKRLGKEDERHLWPEMLRAIKEIKPTWIVGENVSGLLTWNEGMVHAEVCADLEKEGYEVTTFVIPACSVDAPHQRYRVWIIAYATGNRWKWSGTGTEKERWESGLYENWELERRFEGFCILETPANAYLFVGRRGLSKYQKREKFTDRNYKYVANSGIFRLQRSFFDRSFAKKRKVKKESRLFSQSICGQWSQFPTQSPVCGGDDGLPTELDGITFSTWRNESIKGYGNAVVPQVVFEIFKAIESVDKDLQI